MRFVNYLFGFFACALAALPTTTLAADIAQGQKRAAVCFSCHGQNGIAKIPGVPNLGGQNRDYLEKALHAYREGQLRQDPTMTAMAKPLSDSDITNIATYFSLQTPTASGLSAAEAVATYQRIKPIGEVATQTVVTNTATPARDGQTIYNTTCVACHGSGVTGAPKMGDKAAWQPRIAQGADTLFKHALSGFNAMPPRGTCANCSDDEIKNAIDYMVKQSK